MYHEIRNYTDMEGRFKIMKALGLFKHGKMCMCIEVIYKASKCAYKIM